MDMESGIVFSDMITQRITRYSGHQTQEMSSEH